MTSQTLLRMPRIIGANLPRRDFMLRFGPSIFAVLRPALVATTLLLLPADFTLAQSGPPSAMDLGREAAGQTAEWVEEKIKERFSEDSLVRQATEKVKKHPDLAKKLGQAALNADRDNWWATSREVLGEYAQRELKEQQEKGIDIWKNLGREIINPSGSLSRVGLDPVDLYAQGVDDWADFVEKTEVRHHRAVLDCYYDGYRQAAAEGGHEGAREEIESSLGLKIRQCGEKDRCDSVASCFTRWIKRRSSGAATLGKFGLSEAELASLLKDFHEQNAGRPDKAFSDWMRERFEKNLRDRKNALREAMAAEQARATGQAAAAPEAAPLTPGNDPALLARLDSAFAALDAFASALELRTRDDRAQCARVSDALMPDTPDSIPSRLKAVQEIVDQAVFARNQIEADKDLYDVFRSALDAAGRSAGLADDAARAACKASQAADPDLAAIRADAEKTGNLAVLASQIADRARDAADKLLPRLASTDILPTVAQSLERIRSRVGDVERLCDRLRQPIKQANDLVAQMQTPGTEISRALNEAAGGKLKPETTAVYQSKLDNHISRVKAITDRIESCSRDIRSVVEMCSRVQQDVTNQLAAIEQARNELTADREVMANQVNFDKVNLQDHINRAAAAKARADQCLADARNKKPAVDPRLLGEANDLGDPSKATCKSADLRNRAARLRDPKYAAIPGVKDKAAELERLAGIYDSAKGHFDTAKSAYERADFPVVHAELDKAQAQIDSMGGKVDCSSSRQSIQQGRDRADRLATAIQRAKETLYQCDADTLRTHAEAIDDKSTHPALHALKQRMQRQLAALNGFGAANVTYKVGDLDKARGELTAIQRSLAGAPADDCPILRQKIDSGLDRIATLTRVAAQADEMIRRCDVSGIQRFNYELQDNDQATLRNLRSRLNSALETCRRARSGSGTTDVASAHRECRTRLGSLGLAVHDVNSITGYRCDCEQPYKLDGSACVRRKTENELAAERDATCPSGYRAGPVNAAGKYNCLPNRETADAGCRQQNGAGYFAGTIKDDGSSSCIPSKEVADAWCRENGGPGAVAGRINAEGSFQCVLTQAGANARCQQANPGMSDVYASRIKADGSFTCLRSQPTVSRTPQPQHDAASSAAAAAVAGAVIQGVIGVIGNRRSSGGHVVPQRQSNCRPVKLDLYGSRPTRWTTHDPRSSTYLACD
ncbi:MAG: hypothetical protein IT539_18545 [Bradyrhizobiaceae bacterium]|nr:hypothetical protein [Bradyrhizobiaceae bacterium]